MNRSQELKLLYDELRILFNDGIDEAAAFDRLNSDQRFDYIRRTDIRYLYQKLQKKFELDDEQQDLDKEKSIFNTSLDQLKVEQKHLSAELRRIDKESQLLNTEQGRVTNEHVQLKPYRRNAKKFFVSADLFTKSRTEIASFYQGRYLFAEPVTKENKYVFDLIDTFHQKSKKITVQSNNNFERFYELATPYVLLVEEQNDFDNRTLCLMNFDPSAGEMQLIQTSVCQGYVHIFIDSSDPNKFILVQLDEIFGYYVKKCSVVNGRLQIGKKIEGCYCSKMATYCNDQLLYFTWDDDYQEMHNATMKIFDLKRKKKRSFDLELLSDDISILSHGETGSYAWVGNRCFVSIKFVSSENYGVAFVDPQVRNWTVLEFACKIRINYLQSSNNQELMLHTSNYCYWRKDFDKKDRKIYKIPMRKPDHLRCLAWFKFVELIRKTKGGTDPYRKARMRLTRGTDIQLFKSIQ